MENPATWNETEKQIDQVVTWFLENKEVMCSLPGLMYEQVVKPIEKQRDEAREANECDRTKLCEAIKKMREALRQREWLASGRGCYQYDDDRWYGEFEAAFNEIHAEIENLNTVAISWANCPPPGSKNIDEARVDLKQKIAELEQELVVRTVERDAWINYTFSGDLDPNLVPLRYLHLPPEAKPNLTALQKAMREVHGVLDLIPTWCKVSVREGGDAENVYATVSVSVAKTVRELEKRLTREAETRRRIGELKDYLAPESDSPPMVTAKIIK